MSKCRQVADTAGDCYRGGVPSQRITCPQRLPDALDILAAYLLGVGLLQSVLTKAGWRLPIVAVAAVSRLCAAQVLFHDYQARRYLPAGAVCSLRALTPSWHRSPRLRMTTAQQAAENLATLPSAAVAARSLQGHYLFISLLETPLHS